MITRTRTYTTIDRAFLRYEAALEKQRRKELAEKRAREDAAFAAQIPVLPW